MKKKILSVILICGLCVGITACGGNDDEVLSDKLNQSSVSDVAASEEASNSENSENSAAEKDNKSEAEDNNAKAENESVKKAEATSKSVEIADEVGMMEFRSENGYSVIYPKKYTVVPESSEIDFLITDDISGSSVNISTINGDSEMLFEIEKEGYETMMGIQDMEISLDLYEITQINGIDALRIQYTYDDTVFMQTFFRIDEKRTHCVTFSKTSTVADDVAAELEHIGETLKNTL